LFPSRTAVENLVLSQRLAGHPRGVAVDAAYRMLRRLDLLGAADRFPRELSRSEHRLACIARAVLRRPRLLVADEPGQGLRPEAAAIAKTLLAEAVTQGALLVMASSADEPAAPVPDTAITLTPPATALAAC
ncbi:MAG: ATP-binding cassette domain-containing protein, partial [Kiloniellaceae bacterium]